MNAHERQHLLTVDVPRELRDHFQVRGLLRIEIVPEEDPARLARLKVNYASPGRSERLEFIADVPASDAPRTGDAYEYGRCLYAIAGLVHRHLCAALEARFAQRYPRAVPAAWYGVWLRLMIGAGMRLKRG